MKVLLATDGSKHAEEAAWLLAHLPHADTLQLTVLAVTPLLDIHGSLEVVEWMRRNAEAEKTKAAEVCERIERVFEGANARVQTLIAEGHPGETIVSQAKSRDIDLVIIGAVGHSVIERLMLGSVSDFVATHAPCSVLVVRPTGLREPDHDRELNVCLAYDDSEKSKYAIRCLEAFEWRRHTKITVVHMLALPFSYTDIPLEIDTAEIRNAMQTLVAEAAESLKQLSPNVSGKVIDVSHVGDGLVRFAEHDRSDLIVMGDTGRGLLGRFFMGSVSRYVLRHAQCSVWIARHK